MVPGASSNEVFGAGWWRKDFHELGWQWALYKMKCPMAWEITMGRTDVYTLDGEQSPADPVDPGWDGPVQNPDMTNWFQVQSATSDDGISSLYNATPEAELGLCLTLDCSKLPDGNYFARVINDIMGKSVKISVQH